MTSFLSIFPELRELIYIIILTSPDPSPSPSINRNNRIGSDPSSAGGRSQQVEGEEIKGLRECNNLYLSTLAPKIASIALLLCNWQIHSEISATINHLKLTKNLHYEIDCELGKEQTIYPTWLLIPVYLTCIPCIHVTFRPSGTCIIGRSLFYGNGGPGMMIWSLLALLNRFLKRGPDFLAPPMTSKSFKVEKLILNMTSPGTLNASETLQLPNTQWPFRGPAQVQAGEFIHPETIVNIMIWHFREIFNNKRGYEAGFGKFIASRVASISLTYDGEERCTWDLANMQV